MHEIICPHCSKAFKIDEAGYANILKQVRDGDFVARAAGAGREGKARLDYLDRSQ